VPYNDVEDTVKDSRYNQGYLAMMKYDWASFCRDEKFSGEIQIDESLFGRRTKYHRGDPRGLKVWISGLVERI